MNSKGKVNVLKIVIVFMIIFTLVGTSLIGVFGVFGDEGSTETTTKTTDENNIIGENLEDVVQDEKALKIMDIHENINSYVDKEITLEGYFLSPAGQSKVFGVEFPLGNGEISMASLVYEVKDESIVKNISDTDLIKAHGVIKSFEQTHEDHTHTLPKFIIDSVEKIR